MSDKVRCSWCSADPLYIDYHDNEWGIPVYDDNKLFEMLVLEGLQAGLSWITILKKRAAYQKKFHQFNAEKIARMKPATIDKLLQDSSLIRSERKMNAIVNNAKAYLDYQENHGDFSDLLWHYTGNQVKQNCWKTLKQVPAYTKASEQMAKDLKKLGFTFVGKTICYAFMQAAGIVNDHTMDCYRYMELS